MKRGLLLFCILILLAGCGVSNVVNRGEYVTEKSISVGTTRNEVLARFGSPIDTKRKDNLIVSDIFRVVQGETTAGKVLKGGALLIVDVFTLGLSEAVATPVTDSKEYVTFEVQYDRNQRATQFRIVSGGATGPTAATVAENAEGTVGASDIDTVPTIRTAPRKNAYAIVVGIENYRQRLPKADFATNDAKLMSEYLCKTMGFPEENVITLVNEHATRSDFEKYFERWLKNNVEKDGTVFIYYSGHGAPNPTTGDAYIVPYDGDPSFIDNTGYPLKRMYEALGKLPAKEIIVTLDSCFSGSGGKSVLAKGARPLVMNLQGVSVSYPNLKVMVASSGDQISTTYDEKGHGLFTYFMLKGIKNEGVLKKDGSIAMDDLFTYVKPQVERVARKQYNTEQSPQLIEPKRK